ncbi:MAG: hypothetical protein OXE85_09705 [Roseovarius sp.]|nr:hypothetical protein [Roseovarius sp.]
MTDTEVADLQRALAAPARDLMTADDANRYEMLLWDLFGLFFYCRNQHRGAPND